MRYIPALKRQAGTILVIALILLLLLTLIGIGGMRGSMMQERMAGNLKEQHRAFQTAELSLSRAETEIDAGAANRLAMDECDLVNFATQANLAALTFTALPPNPVNPNEVIPGRFGRYCGAMDGGERFREFRNEEGRPLFGEGFAGQSRFGPFGGEVDALIGAGRLAGTADSVLFASHYFIPDDF